MATRPPCLCSGRTDIVCTEDRCDLAAPEGAPGDRNRCVVCWLYHTSPAHRRAWGGQPQPRARTATAALPCAHLGPLTGQTVQCPSCRGGVQLKLFGCAVHGTCTQGKQAPGTACCIGCPDHRTLALPTVRSLLYHVYPLKGSSWRWNVEQLVRRIGLFNGRRIVAVVTDHRTEDPRTVEAAFQGQIDELVVLPNIPELREVQTHEALFSRVQSRHPAHCVFWAHAKGVTRNGQNNIERWVDILYSANLDYWPLVEGLLERYPVAGAFLKVGRGWAAHESASEWHYSGSFCWYRARDLFARDWRRIDRFWSGIEPYPSLHYSADEAGCIFHQGTVPEMNLYDANYFNGTVWPAWQEWQREHQSERSDHAR